MKHFFNKKTWLITSLVYIIAIALSILIVSRQNGLKLNIAQAGVEHNVSGYAWSENFGWVSFNSTDCDANDDNFSDGSPAGCPAAGVAISNYGVNIDPAAGNFSGYAWSSNIGWIDFGPTVGYPEAPNTSAHYNSGTGAVTGWAKILALGNDGWLKMSGTWANGTSINSATGDFSGWAWNGNGNNSLGLGWLSFNCLNDGSCASSNYKVKAALNQAPAVSNLTAPNWSYAQASQLGALKAFLKWQFNDVDIGAAESAYQIIVDTDQSPPYLIDTGKCLLGSLNPNCKINPGVDSYPLDQTNLNYNTQYYWWVKVWDNNDLASNLTQYNSAQDTPLEADDGNPLTFTTYKHEFPLVDFTWFPAAPSQEEQVNFTNLAKYFTNAAPSTPANCAGGNCSYLWTAPGDANITPNNSAKSPKITFGSPGQMNVTLKVTDNDGYYSSLTKTLDINNNLPSWIEVKPK